MERDSEDTERLYAQGFNKGYVLAQAIPELADTMASMDVKGPAMEGLRDGNQFFKLERSRDRVLDVTQVESEKAAMQHGDGWVKSYNQGRLIAQHIPELIPAIMKVNGLNQSQEFEALQIGMRHHLEDKIHHLKPNTLQERKESEPAKDQGKDRSESKFVKWSPKDKDQDLDR